MKYAASGLARDLLATADNLRRAIESVPEEQAADPAVQQLLAGVEATERALLEALAKHGIRRIDALGGRFDPDRHEAVFEVTGSEHPAGTVAEVLQEGYLHHDRLLRPAMVGVAKSGEAPADPPPTTAVRKRRRSTARTDALSCRPASARRDLTFGAWSSFDVVQHRADGGRQVILGIGLLKNSRFVELPETSRSP